MRRDRHGARGRRTNHPDARAFATAPPAFLVLGVTARYIKTKSVPTVAFVPIVVIPYLMAYQVDLAYGNKADRIYNEANRILVRSPAGTSPARRIPRAHRSVCASLWQAGGLQEEEAHWFTSVKPEESKKKVMTPWS